jgi:hypothetical protein
LKACSTNFRPSVSTAVPLLYLIIIRTCVLENISLRSLRKWRHNLDVFFCVQVYRGLKSCLSLLNNVSLLVKRKKLRNNEGQDTNRERYEKKVGDKWKQINNWKWERKARERERNEENKKKEEMNEDTEKKIKKNLNNRRRKYSVVCDNSSSNSSSGNRSVSNNTSISSNSIVLVAALVVQVAVLVV